MQECWVFSTGFPLPYTSRDWLTGQFLSQSVCLTSWKTCNIFFFTSIIFMESVLVASYHITKHTRISHCNLQVYIFQGHSLHHSQTHVFTFKHTKNNGSIALQHTLPFLYRASSVWVEAVCKSVSQSVSHSVSSRLAVREPVFSWGARGKTDWARGEGRDLWTAAGSHKYKMCDMWGCFIYWRHTIHTHTHTHTQHSHKQLYINTHTHAFHHSGNLSFHPSPTHTPADDLMREAPPSLLHVWWHSPPSPQTHERSGTF